MDFLRWRVVAKFIAYIAIVELASFLTFNHPLLTSACFGVICIVAFIVTWRNLGNGLLVAFGELFIGSQGYLFSLERHGSHIPIRMGIFSVVLLVWLIKYFKWSYWKEQLTTSCVVQLFAAFMIVWVLGVISGFAHHNTITHIFSDSNAYLYWLLFLPAWQVYKSLVGSESQSQPTGVKNGLNLLAAALITTTLKTAFAWYFFSKQIFSHNTLEFIYKWIRDTRVGEIVTFDRGGYVRVFFQSHIFELVGFFIFVALILYCIQKKSYCVSLISYLTLASLSLATILMSLSRSFWFAGVITGIVFFAFLGFQVASKKYNFLSVSWRHIGLYIVCCICVFTVGYTIATVAGAATLSSRATTKHEPALSSRWKLLPPLTARVLQHPIIGSGFGTTVTYQTDDPRVKNTSNPEGWYTTYAFEWGYLDIITKIGTLGLAIYMVFLFALLKTRLVYLKSTDAKQKFLSLGLLTGAVALFATHMFTPYLNHPLGIGYLLLMLSIDV